VVVLLVTVLVALELEIAEVLVVAAGLFLEVAQAHLGKEIMAVMVARMV
jgi:hypothetical protein